MNYLKPILLSVLLVTIFTTKLFSQTDKEQILAIREASNSAIKAYDTEEVLSYLTGDVLTTTGNGTLLCGKDELAKYILDGGDSKMYWIRNTKELTVNSQRGLAWESGTWIGIDPERREEIVFDGRYSAMWTKSSGTWKIKSQLFVTTDEK